MRYLATYPDRHVFLIAKFHDARAGTFRRLSPNLSVHSRLAEQIGHLLRVRVIQELELLAGSLRSRYRGANEHSLIRRLTRAQWFDIKRTGVIPFEGAVALLLIPPLNRDKRTKQRPKPNSSSEPPQPEKQVRIRWNAKTKAVSQMHAAQKIQEKDDYSLEDEDYDFLPQESVTLYHGPAMFPSRSQRAAVYEALNKVLQAERQARLREGRSQMRKQKQKSEDDSQEGEGVESGKKKTQWPKGDEKASHAYLICSDSETLLRADIVPLLIALWRVRLWEGQGWQLPLRERWKLKPRSLPA